MTAAKTVKFGIMCCSIRIDLILIVSIIKPLAVNRKYQMAPASIRQVKAARALLGWSQLELAKRSGVSEPTIKRLEAIDAHREIGGRLETAFAIERALEAAGVEFIPENGGGAGVRLRTAAPGIATQIEALEDKIATIPDADEPSPEAAMNVMRKAVAENDLANLKGRQTRPRRK